MSFIKIDREIINSQIWMHPGMLKFWLWLLLKASFKDRIAPLAIGISIQTVSIKKGQLLFGRNKAEEELCIDGSTLYKWLKKLVDWEQIKIESNNHYSLITICNYESYQTGKIKKEQQSNSRVTAEEQQSNTVKEGIEGKEVLIHPIQNLIVSEGLKNIQSLETQLTYRQCEKLSAKFSIEEISRMLAQMENKKDLAKKYTTVYYTLHEWLVRSKKETVK